MEKKGQRAPTVEEMRGTLYVKMLRANSPRPRPGESPEEWKERHLSYMAQLRAAIKGTKKPQTPNLPKAPNPKKGAAGGPIIVKPKGK